MKDYKLLKKFCSSYDNVTEYLNNLFNEYNNKPERKFAVDKFYITKTVNPSNIFNEDIFLLINCSVEKIDLLLILKINSSFTNLNNCMKDFFELLNKYDDLKRLVFDLNTGALDFNNEDIEFDVIKIKEK